MFSTFTTFRTAPIEADETAQTPARFKRPGPRHI